MSKITIRFLRTMHDMQAAEDLQRIHWGANAEDWVPAHMLYSISKYGGHVVGAYDEDRLVGFVLGFIGTDAIGSNRPAMSNLLIMSKRMAVLPEYRGQGIGYRLKLKQRQIAIKQGIRMITWTFDPLQAANAHLNVSKLGVMCEHFVTDYFGADVANPSFQGDRLVADWWITQNRVEKRLERKGSALGLDHYLSAEIPVLNQATMRDDGLLLPATTATGELGQTMGLVQIPTDIQALQAQAPDLADAWRAHIRQVFSEVFQAGYIVTDFVQGNFEGRHGSFYLFSYNGKV